jgi:hypothetical protein
MSGLQAFQRRMAAAVMAPLTVRDGSVRRRPDGTRTEPGAAAWVTPSDRLSSFERLEIYNRQYWFRILDSLAEDYPGLARAYLAECPSRSFTLRNLGSRLPPWLASHPGFAGARAGQAVAMARLEWAHIEAFDEAALPVPDPARLAAVDGATRLRLQPHLRLLDLDYPVDDLLLRVRRGLREHEAGGNNAVAAGRPAVRQSRTLAAAPVFLAVHRHDQSVYYKRLEPEAFRILRALGDGAGLGEALVAGFQDSPMPEERRAGFLQQSFHDWAAFGWFAQPARPGGSHD